MGGRAVLFDIKDFFMIAQPDKPDDPHFIVDLQIQQHKVGRM